ncbi:hypothetical protein FWP33_13155 [Vibrio parahaemolyticus]|jgi:hypothetical protein|uniref:Uncharacterized protein n=1 Tax=Vibrio jasicida TaxID=766224 RepID=A0AAU9QXF8_9VIBR|nr:hypothetical protein [Vibrio parahaemolyticus]ELA8176510.1 hypothetical protein [Vibrio alginolyticus]CAH1598156.1 hypothetical protein THF1C08_50015 [Vibrio jasicida]EJC7175944.1 hypothetical protein [Vibrio parahaemolyticus]EJE4724382.1 hypothetical protein [Vibrio parahaemolyticus]
MSTLKIELNILTANLETNSNVFSAFAKLNALEHLEQTFHNSVYALEKFAKNHPEALSHVHQLADRFNIPYGLLDIR